MIRHLLWPLATCLAFAMVPAAAEDAGHGPDEGVADGRAWDDYPYACLGDRACRFRDETTGLAFVLPAGWVADAPDDGPTSAGAAQAGEKGPVQAEFLQSGGNLHTLVLNPRQWLDANGPCVATRAGPLCHWRDEYAEHDPALATAMARLQRTLRTGRGLARCDAADACRFHQASPAFAGELPPGWSVEVPRVGPDGRLRTWFHAVDEAGNFKLVGLNQAGGEACTNTGDGDRLCEFTPYIDVSEAARIADGLRVRPPR